MIRTEKSSQMFLSRAARIARARLPIPLTEEIEEPHREMETLKPDPLTCFGWRAIVKMRTLESSVPLVRNNGGTHSEQKKSRKRLLDPRMVVAGKKGAGAREYKSALKDVEHWIREMTLSESPAPACFNESLFSFLNE